MRKSNIVDFPKAKVQTPSKVTIQRPTFESDIEVSIDTEARREISSDCQLNFMNHMLEHISSRSCLNIDVKIGLGRYKLTHVITEDLGITFGRALLLLLVENVKTGVNSFGTGSGVLDESLARATVSVEGRAGFYLHLPKKFKMSELVEDMQSMDLEAFLEGLSYGLQATIHIELVKGRNPHHIWEAIFRALGEAIRETLAPCPWRKDIIAAIKRTLY